MHQELLTNDHTTLLE